ncbi:hypothetical protein L873DRAFT_1632020, partial [Choiromyces venosus 120613-1]
ERWWDSDKMLNQVIIKVILIFEKAFPSHISIFAFDNLSSHACKVSDTLVA